MKHVMKPALALAAAGVLTLLTVGPSQAAAGPLPQPKPATSAAAYYPNVDRIVCEINRARGDQKLSPLQISDRASDVARAHARDMATMNAVSSVGSDGRDLRARLNGAGLYSSSIYEVLYHGYTDDVSFASMATAPRPNHWFNKAFMSPDAVALGLGYDNQFWEVALLGPHPTLVTRPAVCSGDEAIAKERS
ncbi:Cysteine-rich secretory protein family protein [Streptomyces sp. 1222.5]|uniref:CAP domain-containing protein n=1 Tax=unclassified Streptomyces TaxID=2593676 RepID=UPI00089AF2AD|nr:MULTISPECIES: CAP domain-containing protein [unclassified Streptomyces]PKW05031.1 Cysteine-rich secretory protein family protein [Streptomyces sp. 5112.2]SEB53578.1 Cysteine-rich secretory protein family protein [Streptomyces sp. 1222.5]